MTIKNGASYLNRIERLKNKVLNTIPSIDVENARILTESFKQTEGEPLVIRKAKAFYQQCQTKTIFIQEDELIVGSPGSRIRAGILNPDVSWHVLEEEYETMSERIRDPFLFGDEEKEVFNQIIKPYWKGKSYFEAWQKRMPEEVRHLAASSVFFVALRTIRGPGELTPGHDWIVKAGINGIRQEITMTRANLDPATPEGYSKEVYLKALEIICDGIVMLAGRYSELAAKKAAVEKDSKRKQELEKIAEVMKQVPLHPAKTLWEGLQSAYLYHSCILMEQQAGSYTLGRLDQYMYPLYRKDIEEGRLTKVQAQELLDCLWVKIAEQVIFQDEESAKYATGYIPYQNVCVGGVDADGSDAVNELSYMMIQATMDVRMFQPSFCVRYNRGKNPDSFLKKVSELIKLGTGFPAFLNDDVGVKLMMGKGVPIEDAYNWNPTGCIEPSIMGKMRNSTGVGSINLGAVLEGALTNGYNRASNTYPLLKTGDPRLFKTFEEFKNAAKAQLAYVIKKFVEADLVLESISKELRPVPVVSLSFKECVQSAVDYDQGGAKYTVSNGIGLVGGGEFVNGLAAVKQLIYDEKRLTWSELLEALEQNFNAQEEIRNLCAAASKYGNDIADVDALATEIFEFTADEIEKYPGQYGIRTACSVPTTCHIPCGVVTGALPSGRKAYTPLSDSVSATAGTDVNGPTALLKSVSKINHARFLNGTLFNMKLDPKTVEGAGGTARLMNLLKSVCDLGIYHIQFNVVSRETLIDAQEHPEKYKGMLVRVAGYSAYFVELDKMVQDEIIMRTRHELVTN
ncbi:glycyl radical protein [Extibacter muris]|uniref:glycyl radical protein n=1 Tax=Extibacter muris TaxID=1796622 RepID=UPI001D08E114|nr:formate C-acetyltransferase/glycerol dehydratase family glycyl radical enzyme [Extibacter muris]MCB6200962.1 formate C-acetyltransferase/glycerol dehydratase family glycyl radical enzyme [Extibacter muris]MCQ4662292.1 formate C-acetyltransferase/glycerol dehydratase family glycyl radical enzyme [Extibacter muris]MCQ4691794.1 formate C-acetyltransferase/glycerol dehydratase family glycyl radical enzyme [Extibacter muris]